MARAKKKPSFAKQLEKIVKEIPEEQRVFGEKLAAEIEWMAGTLTELKNIVDEQGAVITAQKSYNTMIKNYTAAIKQLTGFLPETAEVPELDEFQQLTGLK